MTNTDKVELTRYGFDIRIDKSIFYLKKHYFDKWALKYRKAVIYHGDEIIFRAINGVDVTNDPKADKKHYGPEMSLFKLRIYTEAGEIDPKPFYSSTILEDLSPEKAYYDLINRHVKGTYRKTVTVALMYRYDDKRNEIEIARWKKDWKTGTIHEYRKKGL